MARIKNASFVGARIFDGDVDAPTFNRLVENAIGDTAKVYDQLTGKNGEADTINHSGDGRGALLGIPYINHYVGARIFYNTGGSGKDGTGAPTWLYACPVRIPEGETEVHVDVLAGDEFMHRRVNPCCYLRSKTDFNVLVGDEQYSFFEALPYDEDLPIGSDGVRFHARITGVTPGRHLFFVEMQSETLDDDEVEFFFHSITAHPGRTRGRRGGGGEVRGRTADTVCGVTAPSATQALAHIDMDSSLIGSLNDPINGYVVAHLNRNQNGLMEFLTGWPAGGNEAFTQVDHDGAGVADDVDPARSRFHAGARSPFAGTPALPDEPEFEFPLWAEGFGAFRLDGGLVVNEPAIGVAPTIGMVDWYAPWPNDESPHTIRQLPLMVPDFSPDKATAAKNTSALGWAVLCGTDKAAVSNWTVAAGATAAMPAAVAGVAVANANLVLFEGSALAFDGDQHQTFGVQTQRAGTQSAIDELLVLGACFDFDP